MPIYNNILTENKLKWLPMEEEQSPFAQKEFNIRIDLSKITYKENGSVTVGNISAGICLNGEFLTEMLKPVSERKVNKMNTNYRDEQKRIEQFSELMNPYVSEEFKEWLIANGFFIAPASINHHGAYSGALFDHSLAVTKALLSFTEKLELPWSKKRSPYIVGMFHDLCKLDNYVQTDNEAWEWNNATILPGHGDKSVIMLQPHIKLTDEELYCIRWHMEAFDDKENWNSYGRACTCFPNVLYTHTADMVAARILGV